MRKKPPPEQKATPISAAKSLRQPSQGPPVLKETIPAPRVVRVMRVAARGGGRGRLGRSRILWASDIHIDGILTAGIWTGGNHNWIEAERAWLAAEDDWTWSRSMGIVERWFLVDSRHRIRMH